MTFPDGLKIDDILNAYRSGLFPMADSADAPEFYWYDPPLRGQLSITGIHIPKRLLKTVKQFPYKVRIDTAFEDVMKACAVSTKARTGTWINQGIIDIFVTLHEKGYAHSVECWEGDRLVGGLYGMALGGAFFGESMFSVARDASKIALVHLCARLWCGGFTILDTQFINEHLKQFGAYEIPREEYLAALRTALVLDSDFNLSGEKETEMVNKFINHISIIL